eukprot:GHVN01020043.1.p1 GENE.GHVN01020043.1~~GHVN01020043.1.p1  ORF type:complete len:300 (-),score=23.27 GHVN01020043.1:2482-3381(-)
MTAAVSFRDWQTERLRDSLSALELENETPGPSPVEKRGKETPCKTSEGTYFNRAFEPHPRSSSPHQQQLQSWTPAAASPPSPGASKPRSFPKRNNPSPVALRGRNYKQRSCSSADSDALLHFPYYLNLYLQVLLNALLIGLLCYTAWTFFKGIQNDVQSKVQLYSKEVMERISLCAKHYTENRCDPLSRVPALEKACNDWEVCMSQDSLLVDKKSQISAATIGEVINAFLEQISWKSASLLAVGFVVTVLGTNVALTMSRWIAMGNPNGKVSAPQKGTWTPNYPPRYGRSIDCLEDLGY